jgi:hypothetical protein
VKILVHGTIRNKEEEKGNKEKRRKGRKRKIPKRGKLGFEILGS